jgi:hypothetical protein
MKTKQLLGMVISTVAAALAWLWFDWKLSLVIMLALWGNNLEQFGKREQ